MSLELSSVSDEELARQTQAGSLAGFEELVKRYERRVYAFVGVLARNPTDVREITQDSFLQAFRSIGKFDPGRPFGAWLFAIARHKAIDHQRAAPAYSDEPVPELPDWADPAELLTRQEDTAQVWSVARRHLPEIQFQVIWLKYAEELNVAEIARVLGKTQTHVKVLLFRARRTLGARLDPAGKLSQSEPPARQSPSKDEGLTGLGGRPVRPRAQLVTGKDSYDAVVG